MKHYEETLTNFMRRHYSDERLAMLLAHAEDGRLVYQSCCCFIGVATADHALQGKLDAGAAPKQSHYVKATELDGARAAEIAFFELTWPDGHSANKSGLATVTRLIRDEVARRDRVRVNEEVYAEVSK